MRRRRRLTHPTDCPDGTDNETTTPGRSVGRRSDGIAPLLLLLAIAATAQAKPPTLNALYPSGARQGTIVRVSASGTYDAWPPRVWTDGRGLKVDPAAEKGALWVHVAADAAPGVHWLRLADDEGATAPRPFVVGTIPEAQEVEPNDDPSRAMPVDRRTVTLNGRLARNGDVDGFALPLSRGETLVASLDAARGPGSPMDGLLQVVRPDGIVVAENDDDHDRDPQIVFKAPADGLYVVRTFAFPATPDARIGFSGGETFIYRLTLTTGPFADHAAPLVVTRGRSTRVNVDGWNLATPPVFEVTPSADAPKFLNVQPPGAANAVAVRVVDHAATVEMEPNPVDRAQPIEPPVSVSGVIAAGDDRDAYRFEAKKGAKLSIRVDSRALGQPLDAVLSVLDAKGERLAEADDADNARDPSLTFTAPADGAYRIVVRDLQRAGGPRAAYVLTVAPPAAEVALKVAANRYVLDPKAPLTIPVTVTRTNDDARTFEVAAVGLPKGLTATPVVSEPKGETSRKVTLTIKVEGAAPISGPFRIEARAKGDASAPPIAARANLDGPGGDTPDLWVTRPRGK